MKNGVDLGHSEPVLRINSVTKGEILKLIMLNFACHVMQLNSVFYVRKFPRSLLFLGAGHAQFMILPSDEIKIMMTSYETLEA